MPPRDDDIFIRESRIERIEEAISKLTDISSDLNRMMAVNEIRSSQQEKVLNMLEEVMEKRRDEVEARFNARRDEVDGKIKEAYTHLIEEVDHLEQKLEETNKEMRKIEKTIWMYVGGLAVLGFISTHSDFFMRILKSV